MRTNHRPPSPHNSSGRPSTPFPPPYLLGKLNLGPKRLQLPSTSTAVYLSSLSVTSEVPGSVFILVGDNRLETEGGPRGEGSVFRWATTS